MIAHLVHFCISDIMVNIAYNHDRIESYFGDVWGWNVNLGCSFEGGREHGEIVPKPIGSAGGVRKIQDVGGFFDEKNLLICGDAIINLVIGVTLHELKSKGVLVSLVTLDQLENYGVLVTDGDGGGFPFRKNSSPKTQSQDLPEQAFILEYKCQDNAIRS